jgi:hypothetical protein
MQISISDSESLVKVQDSGLRILNHSAANPRVVADDSKDTDRDDVLSGYTRYRIRLWEEAGGQLLDLAKKAQISKASPSQVKRGANGVGKITARGYARAFDFPSVEAFRAAAWEWWQAEGKLAPKADQPPTEAMQQAIDVVLSMGQGTREQIDTILLAYAHPRFHDRDATWWIQTLLAELQRDANSLRRDLLDRERENDAQRQVRAANEARAAEAARKPKPSQTPAKRRKAS